MGKPEGRGRLGRLHVGGNTLLKWIFEKMEEVVRIELIWLRIETSGGFF
jgi:hypothetical protein